ncbi:MAG: formate--tetrahydrofolate ligase [Rickettsiales bacterium]|nr:formate--tetrahydrofolate ligase [Rickettsiales bacterium]RPG16317.1 MAG: formate--tetrahydrofolate ligase [Pelagibacteraceae bacterium TMED195]|tara:strand:+ start:3268 stop:4950 length:1683 start_codon:yes stop_codon:yes gene_type:complete
MSEYKTDLEIAREANKKPIIDLAKEKFLIGDQDLIPYGHYKAKISSNFLEKVEKEKDGKLILVTAMTPTTAGEGKTTTSVGLNDGLNYIGKKSMVALREPSLGPCFGMKGGAAGGGHAQVVPMEDINLHFTGDFHAITSAHMLLSAMVDNHVYWNLEPKIDPRRITWRRVVDMNDRALRSIVNSLGGVPNGYPREDGFDITVASEIMAILCLSKNFEDLTNRLGKIIIGYTRDLEPVYCKDIKADGAMSVLLKDALQPNLVQTLENNPAFIHGGPFANIAHGCNTVIATKTALKLADYVVTEAGFGADLGAEKFLNIKCRKAGLSPSCAVVVATVRALKLHGNADPKNLGEENLSALESGLPNLLRHLENLNKFGLSSVVALNRFPTDSEKEIEKVQKVCSENGVNAILAEHWADGGKGASKLAETVIENIENENSSIEFLYEDNEKPEEKIKKVAVEIYRAADVSFSAQAKKKLKEISDLGYDNFPVCMAKTQYSFSTDPSNKCAPEGHSIEIREIRLSAGAEFIVAIAGDIMTMPGLPKKPAAYEVCIGNDGNIKGLF